MNGTSPMAEEHRRLRVLVLDEEVPLPLDSGKRIRTWNLLKRVARHHEITLACYAPADDSRMRQLEGAGIRLCPVRPLRVPSQPELYAKLLANLFSRAPYSVSKHQTRRFRQAVEALVRAHHFDIVHCEWTPYGMYRDAAGGRPSFLSTHNVESDIWYRRAECAKNILARGFYWLQAVKMERFERRLLPGYGGVAAVSALDAARFEDWGAPVCSVICNGVDEAAFIPRPEVPRDIELLFVGSLDWAPNTDAVALLVDGIFPRVRQAVPQARLRIVGRRPSAELRRRLAAQPNVELVADAADVRPHLAAAIVFVVPLRIGGGTRIKILEALAMSTPVVSTSVGAEGLQLPAGEAISLAETPAEFATEVVALLQNEPRRTQQARRGREIVMSRYTWSESAARLEAAWQTLAQRSGECTADLLAESHRQ